MPAQRTCIARDCLNEPRFTCSCSPEVEICLKHIYWHLQGSNIPIKLHSFTELENSKTPLKVIAVEFLGSYKADLKKLKELYFISESAKVNIIKSKLKEFQERLNREVDSVESFRKRIINADELWLEKSPTLMIRKLAKKVNKDLFMQCDGPILSIEKNFSASWQSQQIRKARKYNSFSLEHCPMISIQSQTRKHNYLPKQPRNIAISIAIILLSIIYLNINSTPERSLKISSSPEEVSIIFDHTKEQIASLSINPQNDLIVKEIFESLKVINDFFSRESRNFDNSTLCHSECLSISQEHKFYYRKFYNSYTYGVWNIVYKGNGIYIFDIKEGEKDYFGVSFFENGEKYVGYFTSGDKENTLGLYFWNNDKWYFGNWNNGYAHGNGFYYNKNETYQGEIKWNEIKGKAQRKWSNGSAIDGTIISGWWTGNGIIYFANGDTYQGPFKDGMAEGNGKYIWNLTKIIYEGSFSKGLRKEENKWYRNCNGKMIIGKQVLGSNVKIEFNSSNEECKYSAILEDAGKAIIMNIDITELSFNKNRPIVRNRPN
ncbi:unnamed protein product [Blepharisma stoltei]|uniref:MORN repeat protein n=1 Tax=Blepharisma stoltei TaxID=1481888 RepID=A0AAU9I9Y5_9CILI|nr:unnamed protein product [Blepharisma stoltei]